MVLKLFFIVWQTVQAKDWCGQLDVFFPSRGGVGGGRDQERGNVACYLDLNKLLSLKLTKNG